MANLINSPVEEPFDGINPSDIIPMLLALYLGDFIKGEVYWKTLKKWNNLNNYQRNKAAKFWKQNISPEPRRRITIDDREIIVAEMTKKSSREAIFLLVAFIYIHSF